MVGDLLSPATLIRRGYFEPTEVQRLCLNHYRGREDNTDTIWQLLTFELWCKAYLDDIPAL
jgi:asparagine synthase (glutamine-hydrolysing)